MALMMSAKFQGILMFNGPSVIQSEIQKHLGMFLDSKLHFKEHIQNVLNKVSKTIGLLCKLENFLPRPPLIIIYKSFIRSHLDYGDIIYDQAYQHRTNNNRSCNTNV